MTDHGPCRFLAEPPMLPGCWPKQACSPMLDGCRISKSDGQSHLGRANREGRPRVDRESFSAHILKSGSPDRTERPLLTSYTPQIHGRPGRPSRVRRVALAVGPASPARMARSRARSCHAGKAKASTAAGVKASRYRDRRVGSVWLIGWTMVSSRLGSGVGHYSICRRWGRTGRQFPRIRLSLHN